MNKRLWQALVSVSGISLEAKKLTEDLMVDYSAATVQKLYSKNAELQAKIAQLSATIEPEVSTEELDELSIQFAQHVSKLDNSSDLLNYNRQYLILYPKQVRYVMAVALRNRAIQLEIASLDVWLDAISLGGELA